MNEVRKLKEETMKEFQLSHSHGLGWAIYAPSGYRLTTFQYLKGKEDKKTALEWADETISNLVNGEDFSVKIVRL